MNKFAIITNFNIYDKAGAAMRVAEELLSLGAQVLFSVAQKDKIFRMHKNRKEYLYLPQDELFAAADCIVVLGGDGSILDAAYRAAPLGKPLLGVNMGRVGYMTELEMDELDLIDRVFEGKCWLDERAMLSVKIVSDNGQTRFVTDALNEAVVANGSTARIIDVELSENDELVSTYRADGLVVATPTGSTAYSLSAGGPIIDPRLSCICVTPVCPHSLLARPTIFPDTAQLKVKNICVREKVLHLTVDGKATFDMYYGDTALITKSHIKARLLRVKDEGFCSKVRLKKLI